MYRLTRGDGGALERPDKHPFCMSRVFYDGVDRPEEAWAQLADGFCRWRQTGSEVKLIALKVRVFASCTHPCPQEQHDNLQDPALDRVTERIWTKLAFEREAGSVVIITVLEHYPALQMHRRQG